MRLLLGGEEEVSEEAAAGPGASATTVVRARGISHIVATQRQQNGVAEKKKDKEKRLHYV